MHAGPNRPAAKEFTRASRPATVWTQTATLSAMCRAHQDRNAIARLLHPMRTANNSDGDLSLERETIMKLPPQTANVNRIAATRFLALLDGDPCGMTPSGVTCMSTFNQNCSNSSLTCCQANGFNVNSHGCTNGGNNGDATCTMQATGLTRTLS